MRSILFFLPFTVFAGQALVLTPGVTGTVVDPSLPADQSWRVEFELSNWTAPAANVWGASIFNLAGTGAAAFLYPDGRLELMDWRDTVSPNQPCILSLAGQSNILVRFQRDVEHKRMVCESWNADGTGYQQNQGALASLAAWGYSGGTIGSNYTKASLGFLHISKSVIADGSQPPTSWGSGDWTNLQFSGTLAETSGNNHSVTMTGASYVTLAAVAPVALAKSYGAPAWSKISTLRAGYPAKLDGTGSFSLGSPALTYKWQQVDGPTTVHWSDTSSGTPTIEGLIFGTYTFRLQVTDGNGSTGSVDLQVGAVATDDNGVVVYPDSKLDLLLGPSMRFGANPWEWLDYRNQELFEAWANQYEINGGTWRLETDQKSINGIPRNGTVYVSRNANKIYGVGTNFKDVFCGGKAGPVVGDPYIVPLVPGGAARQTPRPYPREVASCQSDTELTMTNGSVWERDTVDAPGVAWGTWNICGDCGNWYGPGAFPNINYYDNALADYALYYRSGWSKARDSARWLADRWYRSPWVLGMPNTPRNYALASTYLRAAVDGGNPDYDLWPSLREFTDQCFSPWGYSRNTPIIDVREASYCLAFTGLQGLLDPDPSNKAEAQSRLVDAYGWIWGPQQHPNGNYVSNEIEGDFGRTFAVSQGSTRVSRVLGASIPSDYCGVAYASGGTISLNTDRVTITGSGTNFVGSGGKIIVLRGTLDGKPWSMTAQIASSPAPTMNSLTLVHPWRGDPGSVSGSQWRIYNDSILGSSYYNMFFGQTNADGSYPFPQVLDTDNWYWCTVVDGNTLTLDKPYTGDTSGGNVYRRPTWQNLTGQGSQPFFHGITAWGLNYAAEALKGYNDGVADQYQTSMNKVVDWLWNYGRSPATNGLMYGVDFSNCRNLTILPAHECAQDQSASSNERAYNVETNAGFARKYLNTRSTDDLTRGDQWYTFQFARQGYASPFPGDGYYAEVIDPCCWTYSNTKGYGQVFGVGQAHQWPAARLGGVSPPIPEAVSVDLDLGSAASARVTVTQPSSATTQYLCSSSPCQVQVDARQGAHWAQIDYLSSSGDVLSSASPILLSASGVPITETTAITPATAPAVTASPDFSVAGGSYTTAQSVAITSTTAGTSIRYTTDGTTPSSTVGTVYSGPIGVSSSLTLKAIAYGPGLTDSAVASVSYTITIQTATPTFTLPAGSYSSVQSVAITSTTAGASIRYTTDGTAPSSTVGTVYSGPISVSSSLTLKAIAYNSGMTDSSVTTAAYTIATGVQGVLTGGATGVQGVLTVGGGATGWYGNAWTNRKAVTIDHTKVAGSADLVNFPMLFSVTDANLKTVANGGRAGKTDGTDLLFTASDGVTKLDHELESYNPATGKTVAWVRVPSLSATVDTTIYIYYGNAAAADQQNKTGVWDSNYKMVQHFGDGTTLNATDSTVNTSNGTINGATAGAGQMGGAASLNGSNAWISVPNFPKASGGRTTASAWVKANAAPAWASILKNWANGPGEFHLGLDSGSGRLSIYTTYATQSNLWLQSFHGVVGPVIDPSPFSIGVWQYVAFVADGSMVHLYLNGAEIGTPAAYNGLLVTSLPCLGIGAKPNDSCSGADSSNPGFWNGLIDEARISSTNLSAGRIATDYHNQSSPSTFFRVGGQE